MELLERIVGLLEGLCVKFDYILDTGEKVVVVRASCSGDQFLYEAENLVNLYLILVEEVRRKRLMLVWK